LGLLPHARGGLSETGFPVAWQHVNLYGRYEFRKQPDPSSTVSGIVF